MFKRIFVLRRDSWNAYRGIFLLYFLVNLFFNCNIHSEQCTVYKCTVQGVFTKRVCLRSSNPGQEQIITSPAYTPFQPPPPPTEVNTILTSNTLDECGLF